MNVPLVRLDVDRGPGGRTVVRVVGEIDLSNAADLERCLDGAAADTTELVIDLTAVTYLDSQGVRVLQRLATRCQEHAPRVTLVASQHSVAGDVLTITCLGDVVPVVEPPPASPPGAC